MSNSKRVPSEEVLEQFDLHYENLRLEEIVRNLRDNNITSISFEPIHII